MKKVNFGKHENQKEQEKQLEKKAFRLQARFLFENCYPTNSPMLVTTLFPKMQTMDNFADECDWIPLSVLSTASFQKCVLEQSVCFRIVVHQRCRLDKKTIRKKNIILKRIKRRQSEQREDQPSCLPCIQECSRCYRENRYA